MSKKNGCFGKSKELPPFDKKKWDIFCEYDSSKEVYVIPKKKGFYAKK